MRSKTDRKPPALFGNYAWNLAYQATVAITPLITVPYLSRVLGAEGLGIFGYAHSIALYFILFGTLGGAVYGQRAIAYAQDDPLARTQALWEIVIVRALCVAVAASLYLLLCFSYFRADYLFVFLPLAIEIIATGIDISWFYMGIQQFRLFAIRGILVRVAGVVLILLFVRTSDDVGIYALCYCLPILLGNLALWLKIRGFTMRVKWNGLSAAVKHLAPMLALLVPQAAIEIYVALDKTMLGLLGSSINEVGYYEQAQKITRITLMIITAFGWVMLSRIAKSHADNDKVKIESDIRFSFRFVFALAFPLMFGLMAIAHDFVPWFFGAGFEKVSVLIIVIAPIILFIGVSNIIGKQYLLPTGRQRAFTASVLVGMAVNVTANLLLIRHLDSLGAAIGSLIAELGVTIMQILLVRKHLPVLSYLGQAGRYLLFGAVMGTATLLAGNLLPRTALGTIAQIMTGAAVYLGLLLITKDHILNSLVVRIKRMRKRGE